MTSKRAWFALTLAAIAVAGLTRAGSQAQPAAKTLTIENITGRQNGARQAAISPDGRLVAIAGDAAAGSGIYLSETASPNAPPKFWLQGNNPVWLPDNKRLLIARENDLWIATVGSDSPVRVTSDGDERARAAISPDGRMIAFYSSRSGHQDIWLVPAEGGQPAATAHEGGHGRGRCAVRAGVVAGRPADRLHLEQGDYWHDDVWVVDVASGKARQLSKSLMAASTPAWSPDGTRWPCSAQRRRATGTRTFRTSGSSMSAKGTERTVKMQISGTDWLHSLPVFWSADGRDFYFVYHERGDLNLWSVPSAGGVATRDHQRARRTALARRDGERRRVRLRAIGPDNGAGGVLRDGAGGPPRQLTRFADGMGGRSRAAGSRLSIVRRALHPGLPVSPAEHARRARSYPALVQVHGGGTNSYLRTQNLIEQYLASKGYVVLAINYRGGSGFGREFQDLGVNDWAERPGTRRGDRRRLHAFAAVRERQGRHLRLQLRRHHVDGDDRALSRTSSTPPCRWPASTISAMRYTNADRLGKIFTRPGTAGRRRSARRSTRSATRSRGSRTSRRRCSSCTARPTSAHRSASISWPSRS